MCGCGVSECSRFSLHRLYCFEKTLRKLSGSAQFALPYWNYFDYTTAGKKGLYLPPLTVKNATSAPVSGGR
ncbi:MAG: hypothetical protein GKR94_13485 [Gammaproteobacteria bacterium]|nr:hypothetical protein [Gammaproteobacteria bacterium]